eukprot:UN28134
MGNPKEDHSLVDEKRENIALTKFPSQGDKDEKDLVENGHSGLLARESQEDIPERETWGKKMEFVLASIGYAVGMCANTNVYIF